MNTEQELKTSEEWQNDFPDTRILDPDGWDRRNWQFSWHEEKISHAEFHKRLFASTVRLRMPPKRD